MPIARFEMPDGRIARFEVPDGTSPEQAQAMIAQALPQAEQPSKMDLFKREVMNSVPVQAAMGAVRGAGSIGATALRPFESGSENEQRRQDMTGALTGMGANPDSMAFGAGKLGAEIMGTAGAGSVLAAPLRALPALQSVLRTGGMTSGLNPATWAGKAGDMLLRTGGAAAAGGAAAGLADPGSVGEGAAISALMPAGMKAAGAVGQTIGKTFGIGEGNKQLAKQAIQKYGIPLGVGDIADGGTTRAARSILNDAPLTGAIGAGQRENVQQGFNRAIGKTFGADAPKLTPDVLDSAKKRLGSEFDRIWNSNVLHVDPDMMRGLVALKSQAVKLPKNEGSSLAAEVDDIISRMQPGENNELFIPGDVANKFQSYLRRRAEGSAGLKNELGDLRQQIIGAFNRSVSESDVAALTLNRERYKAFKTVEPLLASAEAGVAGRASGDVPAALLPQAVVKSYKNPGGAPLTELSQIGSRFMVDRTPKTGGSARAALQNTALGVGLMGGYMANPALALATVPMAAGAQGLLGSPRVARSLLDMNPQGLPIGDLLESLSYRGAPLLTAQ